MTTLYKPVLIESAEQANALPAGTIALDPDPLHACADAPRICVESGLWSSNGYFNERDMIGWTALVPIEAEEAHSEDYGSYHLMEGIDGPKPFTAYLVDREEA